MGPLAGATVVRDLLTGLDRRAVDPPGRHGRHLAGHHADQRLVHPLQAFGDPPRVERQPALGMESEGQQVGLVEASAVVGGPGRQRERLGELAVEDVPHHLRVAQEAPLGDVLVELVQQPRGPGPPAVADGELARLPQGHGQLVRGAHRSRPVAGLDARLVGPLQREDAVVAPAEQVGRGRQGGEVLGAQLGLVQIGQLPVGRDPLAPLVRLPGPVEILDDTHRRPPPCPSEGSESSVSRRLVNGPATCPLRPLSARPDRRLRRRPGAGPGCAGRPSWRRTPRPARRRAAPSSRTRTGTRARRRTVRAPPRPRRGTRAATRRRR